MANGNTKFVKSTDGELLAYRQGIIFALKEVLAKYPEEVSGGSKEEKEEATK